MRNLVVGVTLAYVVAPLAWASEELGHKVPSSISQLRSDIATVTERLPREDGVVIWEELSFAEDTVVFTYSLDTDPSKGAKIAAALLSEIAAKACRQTWSKGVMDLGINLSYEYKVGSEVLQAITLQSNTCAEPLAPKLLPEAIMAQGKLPRMFGDLLRLDNVEYRPAGGLAYVYTVLPGSQEKPELIRSIWRNLPSEICRTEFVLKMFRLGAFVAYEYYSQKGHALFQRKFVGADCE